MLAAQLCFVTALIEQSCVSSSLSLVLDDMWANIGGLNRLVGGYTNQSNLLSQQ